MTLGQRIASARKAQGLKQSELAARAGLAQSLVSMIETGATAPRLETLRRLARALGMDVEITLVPCVPTDEAAPAA